MFAALAMGMTELAELVGIGSAVAAEGGLTAGLLASEVGAAEAGAAAAGAAAAEAGTAAAGAGAAAEGGGVLGAIGGAARSVAGVAQRGAAWYTGLTPLQQLMASTGLSAATSGMGKAYHGIKMAIKHKNPKHNPLRSPIMQRYMAEAIIARQRERERNDPNKIQVPHQERVDIDLDEDYPEKPDYGRAHNVDVSYDRFQEVMKNIRERELKEQIANPEPDKRPTEYYSDDHNKSLRDNLQDQLKKRTYTPESVDEMESTLHKRRKKNTDDAKAADPYIAALEGLRKHIREIDDGVEDDYGIDEDEWL
jgi:hypothetical protein